jgi:hypothetical protein
MVFFNLSGNTIGTLRIAANRQAASLAAGNRQTRYGPVIQS